MRNSEINIFEILKFLKTKLRVILAAALIAALVLGGLGAVRAAPADGGKKAEQGEPDSMGKVQAVLCAEREKKVQEDYIEKSVYQNLNPFETKTAVLTYIVDAAALNGERGERGDSGALNFLVNEYESAVQNGKLFEALSGKLKGTEPFCFEELIYFERVSGSDGALRDDRDGSFRVTIYGSDDEMLETVTSAVRKALEDKSEELSSLYEGSSLRLGSDTRFTSVNSFMYKDQQSVVKDYNSLCDTIVAMRSTLSEQEAAYLNSLEEDDKGAEPESESQAGKSVIISAFIKKAVLGALIGAFAAAAYYILVYLLSKKLRSAGELSSFLKLPLLCDFCGDPELVDITAAKIKIEAGKKGYKKIVLIAEKSDEATEKILEQLEAEIKKEVPTVRACGILSEPEQLKAACEADAAVLAEKPWSSSYEDISEKIKLCSKYGIDIIGSISVA